MTMNPSNSVEVRKAQTTDFDGWSKLYQAYAEFYKVHMDNTILNNLWQWIHDDNHEIQCLLAIDKETQALCGFAHIRRMPSPLRGAYVGFLDDLFVNPTHRGANIGKTLFAALEVHAKEQGWPLIRWITADDNYRARNLYDQLSNKTQWNTYQLDIN